MSNQLKPKAGVVASSTDDKEVPSAERYEALYRNYKFPTEDDTTEYRNPSTTLNDRSATGSSENHAEEPATKNAPTTTPATTNSSPQSSNQVQTRLAEQLAQLQSAPPKDDQTARNGSQVESGPQTDDEAQSHDRALVPPPPPPSLQDDHGRPSMI